jgi:hypothetical protein
MTVPDIISWSPGTSATLRARRISATLRARGIVAGLEPGRIHADRVAPQQVCAD